MIRRRHRGRGEAQPKAVEGQMMIDLAQVARPLVLVDAADAAAVEIAQLSGVLDRLPDRGRIHPHADGLADVAPERAHAHDQRHDGIEKHAAEQRRHRIVRHQFVERAGSGMDAEQHLAVVEGGEAEDERRDAQRRDDADRKPVAREQAGKSARPGIGGVGVGARDRQRLRDVDVEFMRRRELAVGVAGAAAVAEIGEIIEVAVGKRAAHLHRRKHRAEAFAVAAGIADRHQPVGFLENFGSVHCAPLPVRRFRSGFLVSPLPSSHVWISAATSACSCPSSACANCP